MSDPSGRSSPALPSATFELDPHLRRRIGAALDGLLARDNAALAATELASIGLDVGRGAALDALGDGLTGDPRRGTV